MQLYLNSNSSEGTWTKKEYLLKAGDRLRSPVFFCTPQIGADADYVLNIEPYDFKQGKVWTGIWEIDLLLDRNEMQETSWALADTIFTAISTIPPRLQKFSNKTRLLFQAVDPIIHMRKNEDKLFDIILNGSAHAPVYNERARIWDLLKEKYSVSEFGRLPVEKFVTEASKARIQFVRSMSTPLGNGELAQRFFEGLALGPVLTNYVDDLKHTGLVEGEDYFSYLNDDEMFRKIDILLQDPEFASKMAENGKKKTLLYHLYDHRLTTILNTL